MLLYFFAIKNNYYKVETQLKFSLNGKENELVSAPIYIIIGFKIKNGELEHLNFIMAYRYMDQAIINLNLLDEYYDFIMNAKEEPEVEEQIISVKKQAEKILVNEG